MADAIGDVAVPRAKITQACQRCRALKARCLPSGTGPACIKCLKASKECIFVEQPQRRRRKAPTQSRVVKIESKLDGILALLGQQNPASETADSPTGSPPLEDLDEDLIEDLDDPLSQAPASIISEIRHLNQQPFDDSLLDFNYDESVASLTPSTAAAGSSNEFLAAGIMSLSHAEKFLNYFRGSMNHYFPFVIIPKDETAEGMYRTRPILLLAILTSATSMYKPLQRLLDQKFRSVLSERAVFHGEKSLDLLQGLLVYLAWYHFHFAPGTQHSYQLMQIAIGMAIDLGLDQKPSEARSERFKEELSHYDGTRKSPSGEFYSREARRAYVGCYYMSISTALAARKPNNMAYSDYMMQCALSLKQDMEYPTDNLLAPMIEMQHLSEEANKTWYLKSSDPPRLSPPSTANRTIAHSGLGLLYPRVDRVRCYT